MPNLTPAGGCKRHTGFPDAPDSIALDFERASRRL